MVKAEIQPKAEYAFREKPTPGTTMQHVRVIEHVRKKKWKVQWIDPNPGLIDYVESAQLIVPWRARRAFLEDEESAQRIAAWNEQHGYASPDSPVVRALEQVFESVGDDFNFHKGCLTCMPEVLDRFRTRIGSERAELAYPAYVDRHGVVHLPFDEVLELGHRFCASEPTSVLLGVENCEQQWTSDVRHGKGHVLGLLDTYRASWALIRQWAGHDAAVSQREKQIERLERLVWDAVYALQKAGLDDEAGKLRRALGHG